MLRPSSPAHGLISGLNPNPVAVGCVLESAGASPAELTEIPNEPTHRLRRFVHEPGVCRQSRGGLPARFSRLGSLDAACRGGDEPVGNGLRSPRSKSKASIACAGLRPASRSIFAATPRWRRPMFSGRKSFSAQRTRRDSRRVAGGSPRSAAATGSSLIFPPNLRGRRSTIRPSSSGSAWP